MENKYKRISDFESKIKSVSFKNKEIIPNDVNNCAELNYWLTDLIERREGEKQHSEKIFIDPRGKFGKCNILENKDYIIPRNRYRDAIHLKHHQDSVEYINTCYCTPKIKDVLIIDIFNK